MIDGIREFFKSFIAPGQDERPGDHHHRLKVATAALLVEVSKADHQVTAAEDAVILDNLRQHFELDLDEAQALLSLAAEEAEKSVCYYEFTSLINRTFSPEEKVQMIEMLWRVVFADSVLEKYEEAVMRKIAELIYIPHSDFIAAKHRVMKQSPQGTPD